MIRQDTWPGELPGKNRAAPYINRLRKAAMASGLKQVIFTGGGVAKVINEPDGKTIVLTGSQSSNSSVKTFQITAISGADYFIAQTWDGTTLGGTDFTIAKQLNFRTSLTTEVVDGVTIAHTFSDDNHRTSSDGTNTQNEICWPRFAVGNEIVAAMSSNGTPVLVGSSNVVQWVDLTERIWMTY